MKSVKGGAIVLTAFGMFVFLAGVSFAQEMQMMKKDHAAWEAKYKAKIKLLQNSSSALQQTNPDLAQKLCDAVDEEMGELKEKMGAGKEGMAKDSAEWKAKREERVKLYQDAAAALQQRYPDLAKDLEDMAMSKHKPEMMDMKGMMQEGNEKK